MNNSIKTLGLREKYRDDYFLKKDPIYKDRLYWRAQSFRHMVHLLPGESVLELGAGEGLFTRSLLKMSRGENPVTSVSFNPSSLFPQDLVQKIEHMHMIDLPGQLKNRKFDYVVAMDLLDRRNSAWLLQNVYKLLKPGGQLIFYESNPWNVYLKIRRIISALVKRRDPRQLLSKNDLYELLSDIGFIKIFAVYNDFVFTKLSKHFLWFLKNISVILENTPVLRTFSGSILIHVQKPPQIRKKSNVTLCKYKKFNNSISVVIPCHNEQENIEELINQLLTRFNDYIYEIIPVDDNSRDKTAQILNKLSKRDRRIKPIFRSMPNGVGFALRDGYRAANGKYILSIDCDFQHLIPEFRDLFDALAEGYEVVIGSRFSRHSVLLNYPFLKIISNRGFHLLAQIILKRSFRDLTNNLKIIKKDIVDKLNLTEQGFAINAEIGLKCIMLTDKSHEVPISWINRDSYMGSSSFNLFEVGRSYWRVLMNVYKNDKLKNRH